MDAVDLSVSPCPGQIIWCGLVKWLRNSTRALSEIRYPERQFLSPSPFLSPSRQRITRGETRQGRYVVPCFPPHPPFVSINHDPAELRPRMGRCSCIHCHAPCTRARNSSFSFAVSSSSSRIPPPPPPPSAPFGLLPGISPASVLL